MKLIENHWNRFYKSSSSNPSSNFAKFVIKWLKTNKISFESKKLIDIACGNARDSVYFHNKHIHTTGIDLSKIIIKKNSLNFPNIKFIQKDICKTFKNSKDKFHFLYARFFIHAITYKQQTIFLKNCKKILKNNSYIFLEFRTSLDPIAKKGKKLSQCERIFGHYRRFINVDNLKNELFNLNFNIVYIKKSNRFAIYKKEKPHICRMIIKLK